MYTLRYEDPSIACEYPGKVPHRFTLFTGTGVAMHVAIFHPAVMPVSGYGGTERVVVWLTRGLVELGHRVTLIAARGTRVPGAALVEVSRRQANRHDFDLTPVLPGNIDLAHYFVPVHRPPQLPHLWTMQGNARTGFDPGPNCVFVSGEHARRHGSRIFVHNGIDLTEYRFSDTKRDYLLFLGRLHTVKGWKESISIARRAGRRIVVAGGWRPLPWRGTRFVGRVSGERKTRLLAQASALLMPINWPEPFGLVAAEALASGTPVIGRPLGSLPELIPDHVGALSLDDGELVKFARNPPWDHASCRRYAEENFSHITMAVRYVELYRRLLATGTLEPA